MVIVKEERFLLHFSQRCICQQHQSKTPGLCHWIKANSGAVDRSHKTEMLHFGAGLNFVPGGLFHDLIKVCSKDIYHLVLKVLIASGVEMDSFLDSTFRSMKSRVVNKIKKIQVLV